MSENLFQVSSDNEPVWFHKPSDPSVEARVFPRHAVAKMLADKNKGWELCNPDFVPKSQVRPFDEGKSNTAMRNSNTDLTGLQVEDRLNETFTQLKEFAEENDVDVTGIRSKKGILEALEAAKLLFSDEK